MKGAFNHVLKSLSFKFCIQYLSNRGIVFLRFVFLMSLITACASLPKILEKPKVEFAGIRFENLSLSKQEFTVILRLSNVNSVSLPIKTVELKCDVGGKPFAEGHSLQAVDLPAHGSALMELHLLIYKDSLAQLIKDILFHPNDAVKYHLIGFTTVTQLELRTDFEFSGTTDLAQLLGKKSP
jgi:LEA14-like dessication related protein